MCAVIGTQKKRERKKERARVVVTYTYVLIRYVYIYIRILLYMEDIVRTRLWWISSLVLGAMTLLSSLKFQVMGTIYSYYYYCCWVHCILFLLSLLFNNMKGRREPKDIDGPQLCRHPGFFLFEFLRLVVFLFSSTLFFEYYSIPSIVVSDWSPDFLFFFFFSSCSFEIGFKMAFPFFLHSFFVIHLCRLCRGTWQSKHFVRLLLPRCCLSCIVTTVCVCVCGRIAESRPFPGLFSLFYCLLVIWQENICRTCDTPRGDYSIKTSAVVFACPSPACLCLDDVVVRVREDEIHLLVLGSALERDEQTGDK